MSRHSLFSLLALVALSSRTGQPADFNRETGSYLLQNYLPKKDYNASPENWQVVQDKRGITWVANTSAVLEFDGTSWRKIAVPGGSVVTSIAIDNRGSVYVGATGDFGLLIPDSTGTPRFSSLLSHVPQQDRQFSRIWRTLSSPQGVYFSSYERLFRLNPDGTVKVWRPRSTFARAAVYVSGSLYVKTKERGLLQMRGDELVPVSGGEIFTKVGVADVAPYSGGVLIAGTDRLYRLSASGIDPFPTSGETYFAKNNIYSIATLPNGTITVGTRIGGLVMLDSAGKIERIITSETDGLPDNHITSLYCDPQGSVWLTSVTGISRLNLGLSRFEKGQGLKGDMLTSLRHGDTFYAGTTAGLFRLRTVDVARPSFEQVPQLPGPFVWSLLSHGGDLLATTDQGLYQVTDSAVIPLLRTNDALFDVSASVRRSDVIFVAGNGSLYRLQKVGNVWKQTGELSGKGTQFRTILEDTDGKVWATTQGGVWQVDFDQNPVKPEAFGKTEGVPPGSINARRFQNRIVFATSQGLRRYDEQTKRFVFDPGLGPEFADGSHDIVNIFEDRSGNVWITGENDHGNKYHGILRKQPSGYKWYPSPLVRAGIDEIFWISFDDDGVAWAAGSDGVLFRWDPALYGDPDRNFSVLTRKAQIIGEKSAIYGGDSTVNSLTLPYRSEALRFEFAAPFYEEPSAVEYQVLLDGSDNKWTPWNHESFKEYTNLRENSYQLRVRARSPHGAIAEESTFSFEVLAPWYRTYWAYGAYAILAAIGVWGIVRWRVRQLEADKHQLEVIVEERTVEIREQRDEIQVQERKSHSLLLNILPAKVADELKATGVVKPVGFDDVTVCFTDFVGFTVSSEKMPPDGLVNALNEYFTAFDEIIARYQLEKLKTIGDSYMFVSGLPVKRGSHAVDAVLAALEMGDVVKRLANKTGGTGWNIRIGLHSGPVIAGVVGIRKFAFDIWGNTVNFAARMESSGVPGRVNMSDRTFHLLRNLIECEDRGNIRIKEGRELPMYLAKAPSVDLTERYRREFGEDPIWIEARAEALAV